MMKQIQVFYQNRKSTNTRRTIGDTVIVHQANENVFKRARIIDYNASLDKYRVQSLDYGDKAICQLSDIYDVEKSFVRLPSLAVWCSLQNVVVNYSRVEIQEKIDKYIDPTRNIKCDFLSTIGNITYVEMLIDGVSFRDSLIADSTISLFPIGECQNFVMVIPLIMIMIYLMVSLHCSIPLSLMICFFFYRFRASTLSRPGSYAASGFHQRPVIF